MGDRRKRERSQTQSRVWRQRRAPHARYSIRVHMAFSIELVAPFSVGNNVLCLTLNHPRNADQRCSQGFGSAPGLSNNQDLRWGVRGEHSPPLRKFWILRGSDFCVWCRRLISCADLDFSQRYHDGAAPDIQDYYTDFLWSRHRARPRLGG